MSGTRLGVLKLADRWALLLATARAPRPGRLRLRPPRVGRWAGAALASLRRGRGRGGVGGGGREGGEGGGGEKKKKKGGVGGGKEKRGGKENV